MKNLKNQTVIKGYDKVLLALHNGVSKEVVRNENPWLRTKYIKDDSNEFIESRKE